MLDKILSLIDAGYTKDEIKQIMALSTPPTVQPSPAAQDVRKKEPDVPIEREKPSPTSPEDTKTPIYALTSAQLTELIQSINLQNAGGDIDLPKTADQVVAERFNALFHIEHTDK